MRARTARRLLGSGLLSLTLLAPAAASGAATPAGKEELDTRRGDVATVPERTRDARESFARQSGGGMVDEDRTTGSVRSVSRTDRLLTRPSTQDEGIIALDYVRDNATVFGIDGTDLASLSLAARYTSPNGVTHLTWKQTSRGLDSYDNLLTVNVARDGRVVNVTGSLVHDLDVRSTSPDLSASEALAAAQRDVGVSASAPPASSPAGIDRRTNFLNGDSARLVAFADKDGDRLAWRLTVAGDDPYVYDVVVDAATGRVLARHSLTSFANSASVYDYHPGAASGGTAHTVDLAPYLNTPAAPTNLEGPYAHAYADVGAPNGFDAGEDIPPSSGTDFVFPLNAVSPCGPGLASVFTTFCTWSGHTATRADEPVNRAQTTTQLFYYVNNFHDWLAAAPIGFNNASHNFEVGGTGGDDPVDAEADDSSGFDNANMNTPPDGTRPRMQMYLFTDPVVNSGDDAAVVYHEFVHGLSNRLHNNGLGGGLNARQSRAMGEGWSDFYGMDYLVEHGYIADTAADGEVVEGDYVTNGAPTGIRTNAIDCSIGSANATNCPGTAGAGAGGHDFGDMGKVIAYNNNNNTNFPLFNVHADGEIWSETLWDLRKTIGAAVTRGLVTEAMRLSPSSPTYLDARDAILLADQVAGGTNHAQIWTVFAARGMGYSASVTSAESTRADAAFDLPPASIATAAAPTVTDPVPLGDGDGTAESGETVLLRIPVRNTTAAQLTGVAATLTTSTPGVVVGQPKVVYPNLAVKAIDTGDIPFAVTLPTWLPCATIVALSLSVNSNQGVSTPQSLTLDLGTLSGTTYTATDLPQSIPNFNLSGPTSTINVPDVANVNRLRVTTSVSHQWVGDLQARLTAPDGTQVELFERPGGTSVGARIAGFTGVAFDDRAPTGIQDLPGWDFVSAASPAISGVYKPNEPLSKFTGLPQAGDWKLRIIDVSNTTNTSSGSFTAFSIQSLQGPPACSTTVTPPVLATLPASPVATTSATLNGTVDPATASADHEYQWGLTTAYGNVAGAGTAAANSGPAPHPAAIAGLAANTTYHYRLVARRAGTVVMLTPDATFTTSAAATTYPTVVAADTPKGYWRFAEASGLTALDSSGNANHGTYTNGPVLGVPGALTGNSAVRMDGVNDTTRVPDANSLDVGDSFSAEGWIKRSSTAQTHTMMVKGFQVTVMSAASGSQVWLRKPNVSTIARTNVGVAAGGYHHIVVTKNGAGAGTVKIYIDGAPVTVVDVSPAQVIQNTTTALVFGASAGNQADFDEFAVYDQVLTPARVAAHYAAAP